MNSELLSLLIFGCLAAGVGIGRILGRLLPQHHLTGDTKDAVKLAMGLIATMSALLLGLLVSSAKGSYDTVRSEILQMAAKISLLDRMLALYGPDAAPLRVQFRTVVESAAQQMWSQDAHAATSTHAGNALYTAIQTLSPQDEVQRNLKSQAASVAVDIAQIRALLHSQSVASISGPLLVVVVIWLVVIFLSF